MTRRLLFSLLVLAPLAAAIGCGEPDVVKPDNPVPLGSGGEGSPEDSDTPPPPPPLEP